MRRLEVSGAVRPIYESLGVKRLINKYKRYLKFLSRCQLYIKAILSYTLKMASSKPKHVVATVF